MDMSLARLKTDYIDLYQIHRWDSLTPIEETMEALHDVVRAGKVRYLGASSIYAWQFAKAQEVARWSWVDPLRQHAEPDQFDLSGGGARNGATLPRPGRRADPMVANRTREACAARRNANPSDRRRFLRNGSVWEH
jgi:hypothetical protein